MIQNRLLTQSLKALVFVILTGLNIHHALAGNSGDRGGGDWRTELESSLPKSIEISVAMNYPRGKSDTIPLLNRHACFFSCAYDEPDRIGASFRYDLKILPRVVGYQYQIDQNSVSGHYWKIWTGNQMSEFPLKLTVTEAGVPPYPFPGAFPVLSHLQYHIFGLKMEIQGGGTDTVIKEHDTGLGTWYFENYRDRITWKVRIDGENFETEQPLVDRLNRIEKTLLAQVDLASIPDTQNLKFVLLNFFNVSLSLSDFSPLMREYRQRNLRIQDPLLMASDVMRTALVERVESDALKFMETAKTIIQPDLTCDQQKYADLVSQLENWNVGSASYISDVNGDWSWPEETTLFNPKTTLQTIGLRQKLRKELKPIAKRCEPQSAKTKVDFAIND